MKFKASRLSDGNRIFPAEIHIEHSGIYVKIPGFFKGLKRFIYYEHISAVRIDTPLIGFSGIMIFHQGDQLYAYGFTKNEVNQMKEAIDKGKRRGGNRR